MFFISSRLKTTAVISMTMLFFTILPIAAAEPLRIAVLPFEINSAQNLNFLKDGIQDMLSSRLTWQDQITVIDKTTVKSVTKTVKAKGFTGESLALLAGGELQANYVIFGSLTILGNSTSIDSKLIDISGKQQPIPFSRQTGDLGGVIPAINQFATTINETVFRRRVPALSPNTGQSIATMQQTRHAPIPSNATGSVATSNIPPKKMTNRKGTLNPNFTRSPGRSYQGDSPNLPNPAFSSAGNAEHPQGSVWKSRPFNHLINGIALGDVNNDNLIETVIISDHTVFVYQFANGRFVKLAEAAHNKISTFLSIDIGDINGNGTSEMFITSLAPEKNALNSFVLEYSGRSYKQIAKNMPWYFKISNTSPSQPTLLGQKQKSRGKDIYSASIHRMVWNGNAYKQQAIIMGAGKANVMGSTIVSAGNRKTSGLLAYDKSNFLTLLSSSGKRIWKDIDKSGGTMNSFELPKESPTDTASVHFYPSIIRTADIDSDGKKEIFYATNQDAVMGMLSNLKSFEKGYMTCASWNGSALVPNWTTPQLAGRISSFLVGDFNNDGLMDLLLSEISKEGFTKFSGSTSFLIAYRIME